MEISVDEVRAMLGGYVLELLGKDKEIAQLKAEIEKLKEDKEASKPRNLEMMKERAQ